MSYKVHFSFSWCIAGTLTVPAGTKAAALAHVERVESVLGLKRVSPGKENVKAYGPNYPARWNSWKRDFSKIDQDLLCKTVEDHNAWVRQMYDQFGAWAKTPFQPTTWIKESEQLTPADAREFWHGFEIIHLTPDLWSRDYYRARMESVYSVMRGVESEGCSFDAKSLTQQQAGAVINLFSAFLDSHDLRLDVVQNPGRGFNGQDRLASSYDGGYDWCDGCFKPIDYDCIGDCKRRKCPLREEQEDDK